MCGIAGRIGAQPLDASVVGRTLDLMQRRGPDAQCHRQWRFGPRRMLDLMHSRLSIIDVDPRSNQPFQVGNLWVVFNGELYNYREIRDELIADGYHPRTESDTEILAASIQRFGWEVLDRLEGMWAFAVYDESERTLTLCRDRFGEKPLYVRRTNDQISFGSEIKLLQSMSQDRLEVNHDHLMRFLVNGYKSMYKGHGETFYAGVEEVPPATCVRVHADGSVSRFSYWKPTCELDESITYDEAVAGARERLIRAVELRLRADVPIAFCMSGGVDSNSLIAIAKRVFDYDVHGFTIVNADERYNEQDVIEQSVRELGIRHTNIPIETHEFLPRLRELVSYHDAPVYTITYFAHWMLMKAVSESGYRISVSGTSADELFTGYFDHQLFYLAEVHDDPELFARAKRGWEKNVLPIVRNPLLQDPYRFVNHPDFRDHMYLNSDEFAGWLNFPWREDFHERNFCDHPLRNRMMNELFHEATPVILHEDDLNAMYYSIENRSPFLDRELFEYCYRIPTRHLIREGFAKVVLRDAMRGIVPDVVLDDPRKVGFNAPLFSFLDVKDPEVRESCLDRSSIFDFVNRDRIEEALGRDELPNSLSKFLFYFLSSKTFLEQFESRGQSECHVPATERRVA